MMDPENSDSDPELGTEKAPKRRATLATGLYVGASAATSTPPRGGTGMDLDIRREPVPSERHRGREVAAEAAAPHQPRQLDREEGDSAAEEAAGILAGLGGSTASATPPATSLTRRSSTSPPKPPIQSVSPRGRSSAIQGRHRGAAEGSGQAEMRARDGASSPSPPSSPHTHLGPPAAQTPPIRSALESPRGARSYGSELGGVARGASGIGRESSIPSQSPSEGPDHPIDLQAKCPPPMPDNATEHDIPVYCGPRSKPEESVKGWFNLTTWKIRWLTPEGMWVYITPTRFERLGGRGHWKKWRDSIVALREDGTDRCSIGELLPTSRTEAQEVLDAAATVGSRRSRGADSPRQSADDTTGAGAPKTEGDTGGSMLPPRPLQRRTQVFHPAPPGINLAHPAASLQIPPDMNISHFLAASSVLALPPLGLHLHPVPQLPGGAATLQSSGHLQPIVFPLPRDAQQQLQQQQRQQHPEGLIRLDTGQTFQLRTDGAHLYHPSRSESAVFVTPIPGPSLVDSSGHIQTLTLSNPSLHTTPRGGTSALQRSGTPSALPPSPTGSQGGAQGPSNSVQDLKLEQYSSFLSRMAAAAKRCQLLEGEVEQERQRRVQAERKQTYEASLRRQDQEATRQANMSLEQQNQRVELLRMQLSSETARLQEERSSLQDLQSRYNSLVADANNNERQRHAAEQELHSARSHIVSLERQLTSTQSRLGYVERQLETARSTTAGLHSGTEGGEGAAQRAGPSRAQTPEGGRRGETEREEEREAHGRGAHLAAGVPAAGSMDANSLMARIDELEKENAALQEELFKFKLEAVKHMSAAP